MKLIVPYKINENYYLGENLAHLWDCEFCKAVESSSWKEKKSTCLNSIDKLISYYFVDSVSNSVTEKWIIDVGGLIDLNWLGLFSYRWNVYFIYPIVTSSVCKNVYFDRKHMPFNSERCLAKKASLRAGKQVRKQLKSLSRENELK